MKKTYRFLASLLLVPVFGTAQTAVDDCTTRLNELEKEVMVLSEDLEIQRQEHLEWFFKTLRPTDSSVWMCCANAESVQPVAPIDDPSVAVAVDMFNCHYSCQGDPQVEVKSLDGNRLIVVVVNADRLTQGMGSVGASCFLASATFTLTSVPGVDFVQFEFEEGDHANPGTYGRASFPGFFPKPGR